MKLYSYYQLNCNNFVKQQCLEILQEQWDFKTEKIFRIDSSCNMYKALDDEMQQKKLPPVRLVSIFCRGPYNKQIIHRDTIGNEEIVICKTGFYIPIVADNSRLEWFNPLTGNETQLHTPAYINSTNQKTLILSINYNSANEEKIGEYTSSNPVIINTSLPHRAVSTTSPRAALAIRLHDNIDLFDVLGV